MHLSEQDAELFFELTWSLQFFINKKTGEFPDIQTTEDYRDLSMEDKGTIRSTLYDSLELIDEYIAENPDDYDKNKLEIVSGWKQVVQGKFFIERYLKKHAMFISEDDEVYAVLGLYEGFDNMIHKSHLPLFTKTALLPFKGRIVYDGLLESYSIHFGGGTKSSLKETYMRAKQNGKIVNSFDKKTKSIKKKVNTKNYSKEISQLQAIAKKLRGGAGQPVLNSPAFSLLKAAIELADQTVVNQKDIDTVYDTIGKLDRARNKLVTILDRME